jgi:hypothetical protein
VIRKARIEGGNRFWLLRDWAANRGFSPRTITFVMLNPSTADGQEDDPTIRKCIGFANRLGFGRMYVVNLFSKRATDPIELRSGVGHLLMNMGAVSSYMGSAEVVVFAWGASIMQARPEDRSAALSFLAGLTARDGVEPMCLGVRRSGHPRHPLMLPYTTELVPWRGYDSPEWAFLRKCQLREA